MAYIDPRLIKRAIISVYIITFIFCGVSSAIDSSSEISEYRIGIGDAIQISIWQYEQFNTTSTVGPDGKITIPLLGDMVVDGRTRKELKDEIASKLTKFVKEGADVTVSVVQFNSQKVSIFGSVTNARTISFSQPPSLLELMINSSPTPDADLTQVKIIPADTSIRKPITVNLADVLLTGDTSKLPKLHSGDLIYVPKIKATTETPSPTNVGEAVPQSTQIQADQIPEKQESKLSVNVMGAVTRTGLIESSQELSLTQALTQAGGTIDSASLKDIRVIRGIKTDDEQIIRVDLDKYFKDGDSSVLPRLYSGDTVYVPFSTPDSMRDISIIVTGEVTRPGNYTVSGFVDILDAISMAGGLTAIADPSRIRIRRESPDAYQDKVVNLDEVFKEAESNYQPEMVGPGYIIYVPPKEQGMTTKTAIATRGIISFLADLVPIYGLYRLIIR